MLDILFVILGLALLIVGGNWLLKAAVALSLRLSIPKVVVGMTVVSFATSAPELIVSINAALEGFPDLALGNVVGSNVANLGLVLGVTILLSKIEVGKSFYRTDWPVMMVASLLFFAFILPDEKLGRLEGVALVAFLIAFLVYMIKFQKGNVEELDEEVEGSTDLGIWATLGYLAIGGLALWGGSELLVKGAVSLAESLGVSDRVIGITVVSIGTSIPELAASIIAVIKKEKAISLGNLIGSNIFNILAVLGITSLITPIKVNDPGLLDFDIYWMLGISFLIFPLVFLPKAKVLGKKEGVVLLLLYISFIYLTLS